MKQLIRTALLTCALVVTPFASLAHHSHGNYDVREYTELEGTVAGYIWINPHVWIHLDVDDGEVYILTEHRSVLILALWLPYQLLQLY